jgi:dipeptidyl aminopeptidase/acylaminoacyl peptidase
LTEQNLPGSSDWQVATVETGDVVETGAADIFRQRGLWRFGVGVGTPVPGEWWNDHILFSAGGDSVALWKVSISPKTWRISQQPERLTFGSGREEQPSIATTGRLTFASLNENIDVWSLPIDPNQAQALGGLQRLTEDAAADMEPSITADGKQLVYRTNRRGNWDIWLKNLETGAESPLTEGAAEDTRPVMGAARVVYARQENRKSSVYLLDLSAGGRPTVPEKVCDECGLLGGLSADGSQTLLQDIRARAIVSMAIASRQKTVLAQHAKHPVGNASFSPDGRWIAFHAALGPVTRQIYVAPVRTDGAPAPTADWIHITDGRSIDRLASWSPDGNVLYWISERDGWRCIAYRRLDPATKKPLEEMSYIQHFHGARRSMMPLASIEQCRLSIARDKIVFSLAERTGNIWMTELPE